MILFVIGSFSQGAVPFLVCATSGTTVLGAFDPLDEIAEVCERHGLWLHVDVSLSVCPPVCLTSKSFPASHTLRIEKPLTLSYASHLGNERAVTLRLPEDSKTSDLF